MDRSYGMKPYKAEKLILETIKDMLDLTSKGIYDFSKHKKHDYLDGGAQERAIDLSDAFCLAIDGCTHSESIMTAFRKAGRAYEPGDCRFMCDFTAIMKKDMDSMAVPLDEQEKAIKAYERICERKSTKNKLSGDAWNPLIDEIIDMVNNADDRKPSKEEPEFGVGPDKLRETPKVKSIDDNITKYTKSKKSTKSESRELSQDVILEGGSNRIDDILPSDSDSEDEETEPGCPVCHDKIIKTAKQYKHCMIKPVKKAVKEFKWAGESDFCPECAKTGKKVKYTKKTPAIPPSSTDDKFESGIPEYKVCTADHGFLEPGKSVGCGLSWVAGAKNEKGIVQGNKCSRCGNIGTDVAGEVNVCNSGHCTKMRVSDNECPHCGFRAVGIKKVKAKGKRAPFSGKPMIHTRMAYQCGQISTHIWPVPQNIDISKYPIDDEEAFKKKPIEDKEAFMWDKWRAVRPDREDSPTAEADAEEFYENQPDKKGIICYFDHRPDEAKDKCDCSYKLVTIGKDAKGNDKRVLVRYVPDRPQNNWSKKFNGDDHYKSKWREPNGRHIYILDDQEFVGEPVASPVDPNGDPVTYLVNARDMSAAEAVKYLNALKTTGVYRNPETDNSKPVPAQPAAPVSRTEADKKKETEELINQAIEFVSNFRKFDTAKARKYVSGRMRELVSEHNKCAGKPGEVCSKHGCRVGEPMNKTNAILIILNENE